MLSLVPLPAARLLAVEHILFQMNEECHRHPTVARALHAREYIQEARDIILNTSAKVIEFLYSDFIALEKFCCRVTKGTDP